jgi:DNA polymerase-3 subunit alpha
VAGLVTQCEVRITKRGDSMAIATLEDFTSKMTVVIFPKTYQDCSSFLVQDAVVAVEGTLCH